MFNNLVSRPKHGVTAVTDEERPLLEEIDSGAWDDGGLGSITGVDIEAVLAGRVKVGQSVLMKIQSLHNIRTMWGADPKDVLDESLVPKEQVDGEWVAQESVKWSKKLLQRLGQLCRYGSHQEMNERLLAQRDKRMVDLMQEDPKDLWLLPEDVAIVMSALESEGRTQAEMEGEGKFWAMKSSQAHNTRDQ